MRRYAIPVLVLLIAAATVWQRDAGIGLPGPAGSDVQGQSEGRARSPARSLGRPAETRSGLPAEVWPTVELIERGGPFPYRQDGGVFFNREGLLPAAARGHYREYTVPTPGSADRGARRLVTGGTPPSAWYYTNDHYRSFSAISPEDQPPQ